jgi:hypothetical protein
MDQEEYKKAKETLNLLDEILKKENITPEQRKEFEKTRAGLIGSLFNPWIPVDNWRRVIMLIIFFGGLFTGNIWIWISLPFFSPRLLGEFMIFLAKLFRKK